MNLPQRITYHDPCFMARHDNKWSAARAVLAAIPGVQISDVARSRNRTYCCGAGGGCFWKEEVGANRINDRRFSQLSEGTPDTIAVGCPFCLTMIEDAAKSRSLEQEVRVRDLSELVAEATASSAQKTSSSVR